MKCFFSYSRADSQFVLKVAKDLKQQGLNVWLDQMDIPPGSRWDAAVEEALTESECMLVVLSRSSVKSENVLDEVSFAIKKNKRVIPLLIDDCEVPFRIARFQQIDFTSNYDAGLELLSRTLKGGDGKVTSPAAQEYRADEIVIPKRNYKPLIYFLLIALFTIAAWYLISNHSKKNNNLSKKPPIADTTTADTTNKDSSKTDRDTSAPKKNEGNSNDGGGTKPGGNVGDNTNGSAGGVVTKNPIVDDGKNKILYRASSQYLLLSITTNESPSIQVDVNQNSKIDGNYDRAYGLTRDKKLCVQYIISSGVSTSCGAAASSARVTIKQNTYNFAIPMREIKRDINSATVSVHFQLTDLRTLRRTFYPTRSGFVDFTKVYKIKVVQ